jgi:Putative DNA-binding domain
MNAYSPFEKELEQLQTGDLAPLFEVAEGWYIEYKQELPSASAIAKSISAFANTHGGWLFIGVEEKPTELFAGAFRGIARADVDAGVRRIRQAVADQVMPSPYFETKVLWGPCESTGLAADRAVICVRIPRSIETPHVHRNGRIYRRVGAGSEPKEETDRFVLDQLWRRADHLRQEYRRLVEQDPDLSEDEAQWPFMRLILICDLWEHGELWAGISLDEFRELMSETQSGFSIPFENVFTDQHGFIARQIGTNDPIKLGLTWRFRQKLISEMWIPTNCCRIDDPKSVEHLLYGYERAPKFIALMRRQGFKLGRLIDLNLLFGLVWVVVQKHN